ncbi:MAG: endonuclease domain-containing protein [Ruminococcaceae bacterium]|nr:endonuclease domain-containing protein [Oscillospiraceae bacterium]
MSLPYDRRLIEQARQLRKNATRQENHLWYDFLRTYPTRFQRQKTIGGFIVDFYCHAARLVIELDGSHHFSEQGMAHDRDRTAVLEGYELKVIRFSNHDVDTRFSSVCEQIDITVSERIKG